MNRGTGLARGEGPRRRSATVGVCPFPGKRYDTEEEASHSKRGAREGAQVAPCPGSCGGWHVQNAPVTPLSPAAPVTPRRSRPETGFPRAVKLLIRARAGGGDPDLACCEFCGRFLGRYGGEVQHRLARGMGGSRGPVINGVPNGGLLDRECHRRAEARDPEMEAAGWFIRPGKGPAHDPRLVPVLVAAGAGKVPVWLTGDGRKVTEPPEGSVAA